MRISDFKCVIREDEMTLPEDSPLRKEIYQTAIDEYSQEHYNHLPDYVSRRSYFNYWLQKPIKLNYQISNLVSHAGYTACLLYLLKTVFFALEASFNRTLQDLKSDASHEYSFYKISLNTYLVPIGVCEISVIFITTLYFLFDFSKIINHRLAWNKNTIKLKYKISETLTLFNQLRSATNIRNKSAYETYIQNQFLENLQNYLGNFIAKNIRSLISLYRMKVFFDLLQNHYQSAIHDTANSCSVSPAFSCAISQLRLLSIFFVNSALGFMALSDLYQSIKNFRIQRKRNIAREEARNFSREYDRLCSEIKL